MASTKKQVEGVIEDLDAVMKHLREAIHGIPVRRGSFRTQHDNMARDVAVLLVGLETTRGRVHSK